LYDARNIRSKWSEHRAVRRGGRAAWKRQLFDAVGALACESISRCTTMSVMPLSRRTRATSAARTEPWPPSGLMNPAGT